MAQFTTQDLSYQADGYDVTAYAASPTKGGPGVIVLHAWWGLTPFFKRLCDRLAGHGFVALAPDLYGGVTAATPDEAQRALDASDGARSRAAAFSAIEQIHRLPGTRPGSLGVIGFSMGAAWALALSARCPKDIAAAVLFYGTNEVDFQQANAAYLGHFALVDEWEPLEGVQAMETAMKAAGREALFHYYPDVGHWFFEDNHPEAYEPHAAAQAWERSLAFLKGRLGVID